MNAQQMADEVLRQLGGRRFIVMTGAKNFLHDGTQMWFYLPAKPGYTLNNINKVVIRLDADDTYTVSFVRARLLRRRLEETLIAHMHGVYADQLQGVFTQHTGLQTQLGLAATGRQ